MSALSAQKITLRREYHDVVCIGFGASALSLAVAHRERSPLADIIFLEAQPESSWQPLRKLPGQDMQKTFMNDLITTENPRSQYSFVKYLHETGRLVNFTNVGKVNPSGELFDSYLRWAASKFEKNVRYSTTAVAIETVADQSGITSQWKVLAQDTRTGSKTVLTAKRVIIATGSQPSIPKVLSPGRDAVVHSSQCLDALHSKLRSTARGANVAVVGDGQAAAEILQYLHGIRGSHTATLFTEHESLEASMESSFDRESAANPTTSSQQRLPPELRHRSSGSSTTAPAKSGLVERLYELQYEQGVKIHDRTKWRFQIKPCRKIVHAQTHADGRVSLTTFDKGAAHTVEEPKPFDLVIAATGYTQREQERLLLPLGRLLENGSISVDANYRVNLRRRGVTNGRGIWLVGSLATERFVSQFDTMLM
jgi:L-ornithine N5-monooxygenase